MMEMKSETAGMISEALADSESVQRKPTAGGLAGLFPMA
ncbi:MAG: hypothetical protein RLZZ165_2440 [Bacteroidota bacterium]|jgi:hypothetical protein